MLTAGGLVRQPASQRRGADTGRASHSSERSWLSSFLRVIRRLRTDLMLQLAVLNLYGAEQAGGMVMGGGP